MTRSIKNAAMALVGLALACSITRTEAQPTMITGFTNTFPNNGNTGFYAASSYIYWYSVYQDPPFGYGYNLQATNDAAVDYTGDTNDSGSMYVYAPFNTNAQDQNVFYFTFDNSSPYDQTVQMQVITITNVSWYILVSTDSVPNADGNFGTLSGGVIGTNATGGYAFEGSDYLTIPGKATNGWVLMSETNAAPFVTAAASLDANQPNNAKAFGVCWDQNSYGTSPDYPGHPMIYWIDNVTVQTSTAPPPPPPPPTLGNAEGGHGISPAVQGLNLFTGSGTSLYNREDIQATQNNYSWVGASGPVSYSFTITNYPVGTNDAVQCQIFLIPNPGTESAPDYTEPNIIFMDLESDVPNGGGAQWNFRYKTNEPNGNGFVYGAGTLASLGTNTAIGTWTVTFNNNTNVTMTIPGGASTNFSIPDSTGATAALFASGVNLYFGAQAGNTGGANDHIVATDFKVTGLGSVDFDDNFVADAGVLNSGIWTVNAAYPSSIQMVGPGNPYWIQWTTPAPGYILETTPVLSDNSTWTTVTNNASFLAGTNQTQLVNTNDLQAGSAAFFALIQHNFQLQVLLPGETAAPGTPTGKTGTPTPVSISGGQAGQITVTINAVDAKWNLISSISDTVAITSSDSKATLPGNASLSGGTVQVAITFGTTGNQTVTATDVSNSSLAPNTSSPISVTP